LSLKKGTRPDVVTELEEVRLSSDGFIYLLICLLGGVYGTLLIPIFRICTTQNHHLKDADSI